LGPCCTSPGAPRRSAPAGPRAPLGQERHSASGGGRQAWHCAASGCRDSQPAAPCQPRHSANQHECLAPCNYTSGTPGLARPLIVHWPHGQMGCQQERADGSPSSRRALPECAYAPQHVARDPGVFWRASIGVGRGVGPAGRQGQEHGPGAPVHIIQWLHRCFSGASPARRIAWPDHDCRRWPWPDHPTSLGGYPEGFLCRMCRMDLKSCAFFVIGDITGAHYTSVIPRLPRPTRSDITYP
jgi:hypothetical protein